MGFMVPVRAKVIRLLRAGLRRPLSTLTAVGAGMVIALALYQRITGSLYLYRLNYVDTSTLVMVGILLLRGVVHLRRDPDGQAASMALIGALSFVFCFEALYKLAFFGVPWRRKRAALPCVYGARK